MIRSIALSAWLAAAPLTWGQGPATPVVIAVQSGSYLGVGVIEVNESSAKRVGLGGAWKWPMWPRTARPTKPACAPETS